MPTTSSIGQNDLEGNIQDDDGGTFPFNGNGDLQLIPMLELIVPDSSNNLLPVDLLTDNYQIAVQDLPDDNQALYLPLHVVTKDRGAANVAFIGKMVYTGAANWGDEHQVRLVWVVQALNDICSAFGDDGLCETYSEYNSPQVIHTYPDEWRLTGLSVRENHQSDVGIVFEDPAANPDPDDDLNLWKFSYGLDHSFLAGALVTGTLGTRVFDVPEIAHRFDHNSNGSVNVEQRWNISNTLSVDVASYTHLDEAIMTTVQTTTLAVLNDNFSPVWSPGNPVSPTLLFSRQDNYRNFNLDLEVDRGLDVFNWQNKQLTIHMSQSDVPLETASTISWAPYLYDNAAATWKSYPIEQYWDYLGQSMEQSMADEFSDPRAAGGGKLLAQMYYIRMMSGVSNIVTDH